MERAEVAFPDAGSGNSISDALTAISFVRCYNMVLWSKQNQMEAWL